MNINDTRHVTPDEYSIERVRVAYDWSEQNPKDVGAYLVLTLEPKGYLRNRFLEGGQSYEKKKHGARSITITAEEFKSMMTIFGEEMSRCHQFMLERGLMSDFVQFQRDSSSQ